MTTETTAAEIFDRLEAGFPPATSADDLLLARKLFHMLAKGEPVQTADLAGAVGRPEAEVSNTLAGPEFQPLVYSDQRGRITGFSGLGVAELGETIITWGSTSELYAWCAADTLFLPSAVEREARVKSRPIAGADHPHRLA